MVAWWYSKTSKIWLRVLALVVSSVFFFTQVVGASVPDRSFWAERRKVKQELLASREKPRQSDSWSSEAKLRVKKLEEKDVASEVSSLITPQNLFTVPSQYGTVKEVHTQGPGNKPQQMGNRLIIHIQDAHSSPEAQLNSANILRHVQNGVAADSTLPVLICVEGSSGFVDTTLLATFPENEIREKVARRFLMKGQITGEEYFAIVKGRKAPVVIIYGVEDKRAYENNLKAFDEGVSSGERLRNYLQEVRQETNPLKAQLYNKRLKDLESKIEAYQKKRISLTEYCQYLSRLSYGNVAVPIHRDDSSAKKSKVHALPLQNSSDVGTALLGRSGRQSDRPALSGLNTRATKGAREKTQTLSPAGTKYPNFELFVEASKYEDKIDFSKVDSERSKYIKELSNKLTNDELSDLLIMSLDYRLGKVTSAEYYTYLQSLSSKMEKGIRSQDPRILTELVTSKEGKEEYPNLNLYIKYNKLYDRIDQNKLFSEISELEQELKEGLCETEEERKLVKLSRMLSVLQDLASLKISNEDLSYYYKHRDEITSGMFSNFITESNSRLTLQECKVKALPKFEEFYRIALNRNQSLVDNTISQMEKIGSRVAILIAGGFHTPGITELLRDRNISYVVVTPRLGDNDSSDSQPSPRKERTDFEKAIAGIIGALRPASLVAGEPSLSISSAIDYFVRSLIAESKLAPAEAEKRLTYLKEKWQEEHSNFAESLREKWQIVIDRAKSGELIEKLDFLPVLLTEGKKVYALGIVKATGETGLPFVLEYDAEKEEVSEIIGVESCRRFLSSASFGNAIEAGSVASGKLREIWPFLVKDVSVPEGEGSMKRTAAKVLGLPVAFSERILSNAAFGNIGRFLHGVEGGLNDLIENLFDEGKDVTKEFTGQKSADVIKQRVCEFLDTLEYENLGWWQRKWTLRRKGIRNREDFNKKKDELKNPQEGLDIIYLDSGKNLFWVNALRVFGGIFDLLPEGLKNFPSKLVPWRYAAAHYGVHLVRTYISAGFARRASPDQLFEVGFHESLHILGFTHQQALNIARQHNISYGAKELMDKLAKEDTDLSKRTLTGWNVKEVEKHTLGSKIADRDTKYIKELRTLEGLTITVADMLIKYRREHPEKIDVRYKKGKLQPGSDLLTLSFTELDVKAEDFYITELHRIFPEWRFITEEKVRPDLLDDGVAEYVCIMDSIDGTREFTRRSDYSRDKFKSMFKHKEYGTGIMLCRRLFDGRLKPLISTSILPEIDIDGIGFSIAEAVDDIEGAFLNGNRVGVGRLAHLQLKQKDVIVEPREDQVSIAERIAKEFRRAFMDVSSICHFLFLAAGDKHSDIAGHMGARPQLWDTAIGGFIAYKAGARVVYLTDGADVFPIDLKRLDREYRSDSVFAADENTVSYILELLTSAVPTSFSKAVETITSGDEKIRNTTEEDLFERLNTEELLAEAEGLEELVKKSDNLYHKVRACALLNVVYGKYLYKRSDVKEEGSVDFKVLEHMGGREYEEAIRLLHRHLERDGNSRTLFTYLAAAYDNLMYEYLRKQVENSIHALPENKWMFEVKSLGDYRKKVKVPKHLLKKEEGRYPVLHVAAPIRIELNSSVAADIFFLAMDRPEKAKVTNVSADLAIWGSGKKAGPPVNVYMRVIDKPIIRLRSIDLGEEKDVDTLEELFNFTNDYLSALKAAVVASGLVPFSFQGRKDIELKDILAALLGEGKGFEFVTNIHAAGKPIPRGSGLAVSTMLLVAGIDAGMKFSGQMKYDDERITEEDKGIGTVRTVFGEWSGGSGGGWQDSGGQWGGIKLCEAQVARPGDPEYGVSRGRLLPTFRTMSEISAKTQREMVDSMVLVHCGACQDVGPVLMDVTRTYLIRRRDGWQARLDTEGGMEEQIKYLRKGDVKAVAKIEERDWINRITIVPLGDNGYIERIIGELKERFGKDYWGADSTGCRGGAGHLFFVNPKRKREFIEAFLEISNRLRGEIGREFPIPVEPTVYDFNVNNEGITARFLRGKEAVIPGLEVKERKEGAIEEGLPGEIERALEFSRASNEAKIKSYKKGEASLENNRRWVKSVESAKREDLILRPKGNKKRIAKSVGSKAIKRGEVGELSLAAGVGARLTGGETAKPVYPILRIGDRYYSFIHLQGAKTLKVARRYGVNIPHICFTGFATDGPIRKHAEREGNFGLGDNFIIARSLYISQRAYPTEGDFRYARSLEAKLAKRQEELRDQLLETEIGWSKSKDEGGIFVPAGINKNIQFSTPGHFYWLWDIILNGSLGRLLEKQPNLKYLFVHNIDNLLATLDEETLGLHIQNGKAVSAEVSPITFENSGGGLYWFTLTELAKKTLGIEKDRILGLLEAPACPTIADEFKAEFFNVASYWITLDKVFQEIGITREEVIGISRGDREILRAVQGKLLEFENRLANYVTIRPVIEDYGLGRRDKMKVAQFEKFWGDASWIIPFGYILSGPDRSVHIKEIAHRNLYMDRGLMKYLLPELPREIVRTNVTFGNIGEELHRIVDGLNDLIAGLFRDRRDVSRRFTGEKSCSAMRKRVFEFLDGLEYENLSQTQREKLRDSGIKSREEFNKKKSDIKKKLSIIYLDSGKNLFWVKGKYGAAHYGRRRRNVYVSAGYATRASPDQIYEVVTHNVLHILELSHQQSLNVARQHNISYRAQELMDELAKEDKGYLDSILPASESSIKLVIFDWGNVISPYDYRIAAKELAELFGVNEKLAYEFFEERNTNPNNPAYKYEHQEIDTEEFREQMRAWLKVNSNLEEIRLTTEQFEEIWDSIWGKSFPEVVSLVSDLNQKGYKVCVLSTTNDMHYRFFMKHVFPLLGIKKDDVFASHITGKAKPSKDSYMEVIKHVGVAPGEALFIDDRQDCVEGAINTGLRAYRFNSHDIFGSVKDIAISLSAGRNSSVSASLSNKDVGRIIEAIKDKKIFSYATASGTVYKDDEKLLTEYSSLQDVFFTIIEAARAHYRNLTEPVTVEQILEYIRQAPVWVGRFSIKEDASDYSTYDILKLAEQFATVREAREYLEAPGYKGYKGDKYTITLETLRKFSDETPMSEVVRRIEEQNINDLASFGVSIAVSLGGTKIGCAAVNPAGDIFARVPDIKTPLESDEVLFKAIWSQIEAVANKVGFDKVARIGISSPGPLNPETGVIIATGNIPFKNFPLKDRLKQACAGKFDRLSQVEVFHDADARAKGEASTKGTLAGCQNMMFLNWGTGIGNGVICDGKVYWNDPVVGTMVGEPGYTVIRTKDGKYRHYHSMKDRYPAPNELAEGEVYFEHYLGGPALIQRMRHQISQSGTRGEALLKTVNKRTIQDLELKDINEAARAGNQFAIELIEEAGIELGRGLAAFIKYWKLERGEQFTDNVVIGAGVAKIGNGVVKTDTTGKEIPVLPEAIKEGLRRELGEVADSIKVVMSKMLMAEFDYDGELLAFPPKLEDILRGANKKTAAQPRHELKNLGVLSDEFAQALPIEGIDIDKTMEGLKSGNPDVRLEAVKKIMPLSLELREKVLGHFASLPLSGKTIFDAAKKIESPVPAWNIDNGILSRLQIEPLMRAALDNDALVIFEVGATGALQTYPPKGPQLPQYCAKVAKMLYEKTKKVVTYTAHLDHLQIPLGDYKKNPEAAIQKAVDCVVKWIRDGGMSAAVDTSTLTNTDVKREDFDSDKEYLFARLKDVIKTAVIILNKIYEVTNELGIDIGIEGEVGDVGKELSTPEEAMYYYKEIRKKLMAVGKRIGIDFSKMPWMDVMAIQAGTSHGYDIDENDRLVPYAGGEITVKDYEQKKKGYVFERVIEIVKSFWEKLKIRIAIALHGFSGTPIKVAEGLVGKGVAKTNINTDLQAITWKVLQAYNPKLYRRCYDLARDAAIKELEKLKKKEEQEQDQKQKEKLQKKIRDLEIVASLPFEKSKNRIIYGQWGAPGLRKLFRGSEEKPEGWKFLQEIEKALRDDETVRMRLIEDMTDQELREYGLDHLIDKQAREKYLEDCFHKLELAGVPAKPGDPKGLTALEAIHKLTYDRGVALTKAYKLQGSALKVRPVNRLRELRLQQWQLDEIREALKQAHSHTSLTGEKSSTNPGKGGKGVTRNVYPLKINISATEEEMAKKAAKDVFKVFKAKLVKNQRRGKDYVVINFAAAPSQDAFLKNLVRLFKKADARYEGEHHIKNYYTSRLKGVHMDEYLGLTEGHPVSFKKYLGEHIVAPLGMLVCFHAHYTFARDSLEKNQFFFLSDYSNEEYMDIIDKLGGIDITCCGIGENGHLGFNDPPADFTVEGIIKVRLNRECRIQQVRDYPEIYNPGRVEIFGKDGQVINEKNLEKALKYVPKFARTMTIRTMIAPDTVFVIVPRAQKARAVAALFESGINPNVPCTLLKTHPNVRLYLDKDSVSELIERKQRAKEQNQPEALMERYRLLVNKVCDRSKDDKGVYNRAYLITLTVLAAYLAEQRGEMTAELKKQFKKALIADLERAEQEPEQISEALKNLRKIHMPMDNPEKSIANGLCSMVKLADDKKDYTHVRLTTSEPSKGFLLIKYYYLVRNVLVLREEPTLKQFRTKSIDLADSVLNTYYFWGQEGPESEHVRWWMSRLLIALKNADRLCIDEAKKILADEIYIKLETEQKDSIVDKLWKMLDLAHQGKDPAQVLLRSKDFENWKPVNRKIRRKVALDIISQEFSTDELEHLTEEMKSPTFKGEVEKANRPILYLLLRRLKCILDKIGVRNGLPNEFPRKKQIGGLLMLKEALEHRKIIELITSNDIRWRPGGERVTPADIEKHNITELIIDETGGRCVSNLGEFHITKTTDKDGKPYYLMVPGSMPYKAQNDTSGAEEIASLIINSVLSRSEPDRRNARKVLVGERYRSQALNVIKEVVDILGKNRQLIEEKSQKQDAVGLVLKRLKKVTRGSGEWETLKKTKDVVSAGLRRTSQQDSGKTSETKWPRSVLFGGLVILLLMNSDLFGAVGEIIKNGQQAGWGNIAGFPFGLGLWVILACAVAVIGARAIYREVSLAGSGIVEVEQVRLPEVLGLEAVRQALVPLLEGGQRFVAAIFRQPSKRTEVAMRWNFPQNELSMEEIEKVGELIEWVRKGAVKRLWREGRPYWWSPEIAWSSPAGEKAEKMGEIGRLAESVRELGYNSVLVIGEAPFAKVAAAIPKKEGYPKVLVLESTKRGALSKIEKEIDLGKTLFVVSSPAPGQEYEAYEYFYNELTKFYGGPGISSTEIASRVGRQFVGIVGEDNAPLAEEAMKKKFRMIFTEETGNPYSIFSYPGLVLLALAGVDIERFVESGAQGRAMCGREKVEENPGVQLAVSLEKMMEAGQEIVLVLPEQLRGFGELLQKQISSLWGESKKVILVAEEEFSGLQRYGQDTGFIGIKVGAKESLAIRELKKAGHPVFEVPGKEAMGALCYIAEFGTAFSYLLGIEGFRKPGSAETSLPAEAVVGYGLEEMSPAGAVGTKIAESRALFKDLLGRKAFERASTKVVVLDIRSALEIETVSEATASRMDIEFRVRSNDELLQFIGEIVEAAKQAGNPNGVKFAFASNIRNLRKEVIGRMLRNSMVKNGLTPDVVASIVDEHLIIDRETPGIVDARGRISAERVCFFIAEELVGDTEGNGIDFNIITTDVDAWEKEVLDPGMVKKVLWMVLEPAKEGQALATPESVIVAIQGKAKASRWLKEFIRLRYAAEPEEAERLISQIEDGRGNIVLPARPVDNRKIEAEWDVYKCQA